MNRIVFGDLRDFFTFDPVRHIMKAFLEPANFTFVPMRTGGGDRGRNLEDRDKGSRTRQKEGQGQETAR